MGSVCNVDTLDIFIQYIREGDGHHVHVKVMESYLHTELFGFYHNSITYVYVAN